MTTLAIPCGSALRRAGRLALANVRGYAYRPLRLYPYTPHRSRLAPVSEDLARVGCRSDKRFALAVSRRRFLMHGVHAPDYHWRCTTHTLRLTGAGGARSVSRALPQGTTATSDRDSGRSLAVSRSAYLVERGGEGYPERAYGIVYERPQGGAGPLHEAEQET